MDITPLLSYLKSTSGIALSCKGFAWRVRSNGFPIRTSEGGLCLENLSFYKLLKHPEIDEWTISEFKVAIKTDDRDRLLMLLQGGANIEAKDSDGDTTLFFAVVFGRTKCLRLLLEHKAIIDTIDKYGDNALIFAARNGEADCLRILLEHKANIEAKNAYGDTALMWAVWKGNVVHLKILVEGGAQVDPDLREKYPQYAELWGNSTL